MKPAFKSVLWGTLIFAGIYFLFNFLFEQPQGMHAVLKLLVKAIVLGLLITFVTGFLANRFADSSSVKASMDISDLLAPGENILFATGANQFKKGEGVGGKIYITDRNVVFRSHKYNIQKHSVIVPRNDIKEARSAKTWGIIHNGLHLVLQNGTTEKFVVADREKILSFLGT